MGERLKFLARQFAELNTPNQALFDYIFGTAVPVLCYIFDPAIFRGVIFFNVSWLNGLRSYRIFIYCFSGVSIGALIAWLSLSERAGNSKGFLAGVMLSGGVLSLVIGIYIFPLTLLGLLGLIGVLGFAPFIAALVYLRNGYRAYMRSLKGQSAFFTFILTTLGVIFAVSLSLAMQFEVKSIIRKSLGDLIGGRDVPMSIMKLKYLGTITDYDELLEIYTSESDASRKSAIAKMYKDIAGVDIERRLRRFGD